MGQKCCAAEQENHNAVLTSADALERLIHRDFDEIFNVSDKNRDGVLDHREMATLIENLKRKGVQLSSEKGAEILKKADTDKDGKVTPEEFYAFIKKECMDKRENLIKLMSKGKDRDWLNTLTQKAFKSADADGGGAIDLDELTAYMTDISKQMGEKPYTREEITKIMNLADKSHDHKVSKAEFRNIVTQLVVKMYLHSGGKETSELEFEAGVEGKVQS